MDDLIYRYTIDLLQSELESAQSESQEIRNSLRYRLGDTFLEALPLSLHSISVVARLLKILVSHRRASRNASQLKGNGTSGELLGPAVAECRHIIYRPSSDTSRVDESSWQTGNLELLISRLDSCPPAQLTLHEVNEPIARRLARLQLQGCFIECCFSSQDAHHLYAQALTSEAKGSCQR